MKKLLFLLLLVAVGFISCDSLNNLTKFEMPFNESVTIPAVATLVSVSIPISFNSPDIKTDFTSYLSKNNISSDVVEKVSLQKLEMTITVPAADTCTFKFLSSVEISICSPDGTLVTKIASLSNVPANKTIQLNVESDDLKQYLLKDAFKLGFKIRSKQPISTDYTVEVKPVFLLDVKILGL